jgi:hypothetical protein
VKPKQKPAIWRVFLWLAQGNGGPAGNKKAALGGFLGSFVSLELAQDNACLQASIT